MFRAPWVPLCPKGTAQAKYVIENNSSLEMRGDQYIVLKSQTQMVNAKEMP